MEELEQPKVSASALDFLLIETIPLATRVCEELAAKSQRVKHANSQAQAQMLEDNVYSHVEGYGFKVGQGLAQVFTRDLPRFNSDLAVMKFICKDLWMTIYKKQMDNLKTNHRGTYVLVDNSFKPCQRMSTNLGDAETINQAMPYLWFPAGIIRGVLHALGLEATVSLDAVQLPAVSFNIQTAAE